MTEDEADALVAALDLTFSWRLLEPRVAYEGSWKVREEEGWLVVVHCTNGHYRYEFRQRTLTNWQSRLADPEEVADDIRLLIVDEPAGDGASRGFPYPLTPDGRYLREGFD